MIFLSLNYSPNSGETIAPGEEGYAQAALANRVGSSLTAENGTSSQFTTELAGGAIYAPVIVVNSNFDPVLDGNPDNNPNVYFTFAEANIDGFDHVQNPSDNVFGFEDLLNGGDEDFDDLTVTVSTGETETEPVEETPEEPVEEPVDETPEEPVEEPVDETPEEPVDETPEEPVEETPEEPVEEPVDETPEEPVDEPTEPTEPIDPNAPQELGLQIFYPDGETPLFEFSRETGASTEQSSISFSAGDFSPDLGGYSSANPQTPASEQFYEDNPAPISSSGTTRDNGFFVDVVDSDTIAIYNPTNSGGAGSQGDLDFTIGPVDTDFYTYEISDISGTIPAFENVTIEPLSNIPIESSDISFTEDSISINLAGIAAPPESYALLDIEFAGGGSFIPGDGTEDRGQTNEQFIDDILF